MEKKISVVGIVVSDRENAAPSLNRIFSDYNHIIVGRMGIPYREKNLWVISLIVDGNAEEISAMRILLGTLPEVNLVS